MIYCMYCKSVEENDHDKEKCEILDQLVTITAERDAALNTWCCFHCGFKTVDMKEAAAHFGDRDDPDETKPLCRWWASMSPEERGQALQDVVQQYNDESEENGRLRAKVEGLEYRVDGQLSEIHSYKPFRKCSSVTEVFHVYDSMEGRAITAEEQRDAAQRRVEVLTKALEYGSKTLLRVGLAETVGDAIKLFRHVDTRFRAALALPADGAQEGTEG